VDTDETSFGIRICGRSALENFEVEAGKHCVQRVPPTEKRGRRQTSTVVVIITRLDTDLHSQIAKLLVPAKDLVITTMKGSGPGGQHRNKTESAVRVRHVPTGITVRIDSRDQSKNKALAIRIVEERVRQYEAEISAASARAGRQASWDGGNRSNKIRTYNFIESRAVDHRTGKKTTQVLDVIGKGRFDLLK
jgi:peptide chain release factor 1